MGLIFWIYGFDLGFVGLLVVVGKICGIFGLIFVFFFCFFFFGICVCAKDPTSDDHDLIWWGVIDPIGAMTKLSNNQTNWTMNTPTLSFPLCHHVVVFFIFCFITLLVIYLIYGN